MGRPRKQSREKSIEIAMNAFWQYGYEACSTDRLCAEMGVGKGSFYHSFKNKHDLYIETLKSYHETWIKKQIELLSQSLDLKGRLQALLEWAVTVDFAEDSQGCYLINAAMERGRVDPAVVLWSEIHAVQLEEAVQKEIQKSMDSREYQSNKTAKELATIYLTNYYGLRTLNASTRNKDLANQIIINTISNF